MKLKKSIIISLSALALLGTVGTNSNILNNTSAKTRITKRIKRNHKQYRNNKRVKYRRRSERTYKYHKSHKIRKSHAHIRKNNISKNIYKQACWYQKNYNKLFHKYVHTNSVNTPEGYSVYYHNNPMFQKGAMDAGSASDFEGDNDTYVRFNLQNSKNKVYRAGYILALGSDINDSYVPNSKEFRVQLEKAILKFNSGRRYAESHKKPVIYSAINYTAHWHYSSNWKNKYNDAMEEM